ncbi:M23 family metallopeptidase [Acidihalobacter ferrooxydans]|uniref:M23ase beta-sheet core domain-containing protein n=1 Tax=Acidihalobacter ferrooxydans TaxID=1765967 RepID=A0A1P8UE59_9GAMM|nr:M23 family metallopeptidase [Acidihalobacter ferrooxydans]APZ42147.1 hypothetical protein BW247_02765 [Acidihalobacter ferrooxydans]
MNIIVLGRNGHPSRQLVVGRWHHVMIAIAALIALGGGAAYGGYALGLHTGVARLVSNWEQEIQQSQREVRLTRQTADARIGALTQRLVLLQADMMRVNALGSKLVKMAKLDPKEFDFNRVPGVGGPQEPVIGFANSEPQLQSRIEALSKQLSERSSQLKVLSQVLASRHLLAETTPAGWPITKGWVSSYYGPRTDPFTGRPSFHPGIDFAGPLGENVHAVAGGVVTYAGKDGGYGNMIQIDHGDGYSTRYGHAEKLDVKVGQVVKRGQVIAQLGSTGRSTGPHVHLEVRYHGKSVNPLKYIKKKPAQS